MSLLFESWNQQLCFCGYDTPRSHKLSTSTRYESQADSEGAEPKTCKYRSSLLRADPDGPT